MLPWRIVFAGGFGGIAPSLLDRARALYNGEVVAVWLTEPEYIWISMLCVAAAMLIYFIIGAVVAVLSKEEVLHKAMLLGIGAPALIMAAFNPIGDRAKDKEAQPQRASMRFTLFPLAFAQEQPSDPRKQLDVILKSEGCVGCSVDVRDADGSVLKSVPLPAGSTTAKVAIPQGADALVLSGQNTNTAVVPLDSIAPPAAGQKSPTLDIARDRNFWNDFSRSLGNQAARPYDFRVTIQE